MLMEFDALAEMVLTYTVSPTAPSIFVPSGLMIGYASALSIATVNADALVEVIVAVIGKVVSTLFADVVYLMTTVAPAAGAEVKVTLSPE